MGLFLTVLQCSLLGIYSTCLLTILQQNDLKKIRPTIKLSSDYFLAALGRLAPYFERRCVRFATPAVSSVPRTMW